MRLYISNPKIIRKVSAWLGCCIIMIGNFTSQKHAVILTPSRFCTIIFLTGEDPGLGRNVWIKWLRHRPVNFWLVKFPIFIILKCIYLSKSYPLRYFIYIWQPWLTKAVRGHSECGPWSTNIKIKHALSCSYYSHNYNYTLHPLHQRAMCRVHVTTVVKCSTAIETQFQQQI